MSAAARLARGRAIGLHLAVGLGSLLGALARFAVAAGWAALGQGPSLVATVLVNLTGSFVIGLYAALTGPDGRLLHGPRRRQAVTTGFCGGYTTYSLLSLETVELLGEAGPLAAAGLVLGSLLGALLACGAGDALGRRWNRLGPR